MSIRFGWMCFRFFAIAAGVPFLLWALLTALRVLLLAIFVSDESLWLHSVPLFVELLCFVAYIHRKESEFDSVSPMTRYDAAGKPLPREPGQATRYASFNLTWLQEARHDCRVNMLLLLFGTPVTLIAVVVTAYFLPEWNIWNLLICSASGAVALRLLLLVAEKRGLEHGLPALPADHDHTTVRPSPPEARGEGLVSHEEAQEIWLRESDNE